MRGMNANTGRTLTGAAHLIQSLNRILTTPLGSRLMRREFGCDLVNLIDAPNHATTQAQLYAAVATSLMRWEPRLRIERVQLTQPSNPDSPTYLDIEGVNLTNDTSVSTQVPLSFGARA